MLALRTCQRNSKVLTKGLVLISHRCTLHHYTMNIIDIMKRGGAGE